MAYKKKANEEIEEIKSLIVQMKEKGMFPKGYARMIKEKLGLKNADKVYQVSGGHHYHEAIADELLKLAKENKVKTQIALAKEILK